MGYTVGSATDVPIAHGLGEGDRMWGETVPLVCQRLGWVDVPILKDGGKGLGLKGIGKDDRYHTGSP